MSKARNAKITKVVVTTPIVGPSRGKMTARRSCHSLVPSTRAASSSSGGSVRSPASTVTAMNGKPVQTSITVSTV